MADFNGIPITHPPGAPPVRTHREPTPEERRTVEDFEAVFITEMLQPMFEGLNTDGLGLGGDGEQMFRPMLVQQYANAIAHHGGIGLAQNILGELTRLQIDPSQTQTQTQTQPSEDADGSDR